MKRKTIIILSVIFILVLAGGAVVMFLPSNEAITPSVRMAQIQASISQVKRLTATLTVTDSDVVVYEYERTSVKAYEGYDVTIIERKLGSDFTLGESTTTTTVSSLACPVSLSEDNVLSSVIADNTLSCMITKDKLSAVLGTSYVPAGVSTLDCEFDNNRATKITCSFTTTSGKNVDYVFVLEY